MATLPFSLKNHGLQGGFMRALIAAALVAVSGCESMSQKVHDSRQARCARADWAQVGERDGVTGAVMQADRYAEICAEMFQAGPYKEDLQKGLARRPKSIA
jgi:hypothetical protein